MNIKLKNIAQLFSNVRTRMIILATMSILVVSVVVGLKRLIHKAPPVSNTTVQLKDAPSIQSVPGGLTESPSVDYKRLQEQQNRKQAQIAEQTGQSSIPTLLDTNDFQHQNQGGAVVNSPCYQPCNPCCQAISSNSSAAVQSSLQPSPLRVGTLVYDTHGKVIGRLGADGQVRDENGKIIGRVGPDGLVRDLKNQSVIGSAALPAAGDSVYDATGRVIGQVGVDGKIRDAQGYVIGSVGPDGIARNLKGGILGRVVPAKPMTRTISGAPVFDAKNHLLGTANAKGQLLDAQGKVLGELGTDGVLRDLQGHVIGKTGVSQAGALVNDSQGHLVGLVDADGKIINNTGHVITDHPDATRTKIPVYDAQGRLLGDSNQQDEIEDTHHRVLGKLNEQGIVYDQNGHVLGKTGIPQAGAPAYDANGHLIGRVLPNGDVLDSDGQKIGHLDSDGVVKAMDGRVLGQASLRSGSVGGFITAPVPGAPVYDHQGQFIGTVGTDGKVRNDQGQVLGALDATGTLYGLHHERLGQVGIAAPGTPVYDSQGHLIGTAGPQGIIRNSQGQRIATLGADGRVLNQQGQLIGRVTPPRTLQNEPGSSVPHNDLLPNSLTLPNAVRLEPTDSGKPANPELQAILDRQQQQLSAQKAEQLQQQMQAAMSTQATQLFTAWTSPLQQYVAGVTTPNASTAFMTGKGYPGSLAPNTSTAAPMAVKAGTIMYAVLLTSVNTDEPGPVLAKIVEGKFKGARLIGTLTNQGQRVLLSFNAMTLPKISQSIPINTVAIDNNTARTALSSETNNHYWLRYGTLFASAFIQGYGQSFLNTGNSMSIFNFDNKPIDLSPKQRVLVGLGQVGTQYAAALGSVFNTPPTVHVYSGTPIGILFVADLPALPDK